MNVRPISGASVGGRRFGRKGLVLISGALLVAVTACGGGGDSESGSGSGNGKGPDSGTRQGKQSTAAVRISPKSGATGVDTSGALKVSVTKGKLTEVTVKDAKGAKIDGAVTGDGAAW